MHILWFLTPLCCPFLQLDNIEKKLLVMKTSLGLVPPQDTPTDVGQSHTLPRKKSVPSTPPLLRPFTTSDRGRSKKKEDKASRMRSKSVPRQLFENAWRSPSLGRKKDKTPSRPITPIEIYNDQENGQSAKVETQQETPQQHLAVPQQLQSRTRAFYDTPVQPLAQLDINHHSDSGSFRDDSSTHSGGSSRSQPEGNLTQPRTHVDHPGRLAHNRNTNFSTSLGDVSSVGPNVSSHRSSPRRSKPPIQKRIDRGPPPPYSSPAKSRSHSQSGRYFESPEDTLGRADVDAPKLQKHASSMHDLQHALQANNLPKLGDDELEYHQQATSLSQPPSPKKHASLGNLAMKSNSLPGSEFDEQELVNYDTHRVRRYHNQQYHNYAGHTQESTPVQRDSNNYYSHKNSSNRTYNGSGDSHTSYTRNYASLDRPSKSQANRDRRPSGDLLANDSMYFSLDRRNPKIIEDSQGSNDSSYASLDRPVHKPPIPSGSIEDVSMTSSRRRHNSFSSQRSSSSYSSQGSSSVSNHQTPHPSRTPLHHTSSNSSRQSELSIYTSLASLSPSSSFSSMGPGSASHNSSYNEPQAASMYTTSTPSHLQPRVQHSYATGIATSKTHYTPAQPMTCEPVSRSTRPSQTNSR